MHLIVSEKYNAAQRIATILSDGNASTVSVNDVPVFTWGGGNTKCIGLAGHVVELDFASKYTDWSDVDPASLITAPIEVQPSKYDIVKAVQTLANQATTVTIATDYDREGELIGKEVVDLVKQENSAATINRARFSSLSFSHVQEAFTTPTDIDFDLAAAGEARQIIDLRWGASLTRFFTLASPSRNGVLSVGRVQTPTLQLIVSREREIQQFTPDPYWEITATLSPPQSRESIEAQYYYHTDTGTEAVRVWDESNARAITSTLEQSVSGEVTSMDEHDRTDYPPVPFNTTAFIQAASAIGFDAKPAMSIAETLYDDGHITYPRTDNTVYPDELDGETLLRTLASEIPDIKDDITQVLSQDSVSPTAGDTQTTDHPPIHPTENIPSKSSLNDAEWTIYELVVRRFAATFARPAVWNHRRITVSVATHLLKATGKTRVSPGYHTVYPYVTTTEDEIPIVDEGGIIQIGPTELAEKETQPPNRYNQSQLIGKMETLNLGTKSTRHNIIDKLQDREYIRGSPLEPTERAFALITAVEKYCPQMVTAETTATLETDMDAIASGEKPLSEVTDSSCEVLSEVFSGLHESRNQITQVLNTPMETDETEEHTEDDAIGTCPDCHKLLVPKQGPNESKFVGCTGYPDCEFTLPLPNRGRVHLLDEVCDTHGFNHVKMIAGSATEVFGCPQCQQETVEETTERELGECPECRPKHDGVLAIKTVSTGSRLVGCTRYPDCDYSLPVPQSGHIVITDRVCDEHSLSELELHQDNEDTPWKLGCPICNYESMDS